MIDLSNDKKLRAVAFAPRIGNGDVMAKTAKPATANTARTTAGALIIATAANLAIASPSWAQDPFSSLWKQWKKSHPLERLQKATADVRTHRSLKRLLEDLRTHSMSVSQTIQGQEMETTRFQHYYKGLEVVGSQALHHVSEKGTSIRNQVAEFDLDVQPTLSVAEAVARARGAAGDRRVSRAPELKILPEEGGAAKLVYWVRIDEELLEAGRQVLVDAHTGEVIGNLSDELHIAPISVLSAKDQGIVIKPSQTGCQLLDLSTKKVQTLDIAGCKAAMANACQTLLTDGSPVQVNPAKCVRNAASAGTAAVQNAQRNSLAVLNYFQAKHGRNSFDGRGSAVLSVVNAGIQYANAFWNQAQSMMVYGPGDGQETGDFTAALDVAGHEMTHGVTAHSAKLLYMGESGALNEAYSDFFGKMIEGKNDWTIGRNLFLKGKGDGLRDMANPGRIAVGPGMKYPSHMKAMLPVTGTCGPENDNCWVHVNSMIPGHAAYQVTQAIGPAKAERLYYVTLTQNLTARETLRSATAATLETCGQLYDAKTCSLVKSAFARVGL